MYCKIPYIKSIIKWQSSRPISVLPVMTYTTKQGKSAEEKRQRKKQPCKKREGS